MCFATAIVVLKRNRLSSDASRAKQDGLHVGRAKSAHIISQQHLENQFEPNQLYLKTNDHGANDNYHS